jgi:hypothetical protein
MAHREKGTTKSPVTPSSFVAVIAPLWANVRLHFVYEFHRNLMELAHALS